MKKNRRKRTAFDVVLAAMGLICALLLGAVFYGTMVYQLADITKDEPKIEETAELGSPENREDGGTLLLALPEERATLIEEKKQEIYMGGQDCRVTIRQYVLDNGTTITATTATPAGYIERLAEESWTAKLITGFQLAGMEAILCEGEHGLLAAARDEEIVYTLEGDTDEETMYELSVSAVKN